MEGQTDGKINTLKNACRWTVTEDEWIYRWKNRQRMNRQMANRNKIGG